MSTTFEIQGCMTGSMWWPVGHRGVLPIAYKFARVGRPFVDEADSLRQAVDMLLTKHGGDFSGTKLTGDTVLVVTKSGDRRETKRWFPMTMFASISDMVEANVIPDFEVYG
jgi:hypothetical protein